RFQVARSWTATIEIRTATHSPTLPVQDPNGNGRRCCKMKAPSLVASQVRTQSPPQAWNWLPLTPTTTKYHLNLNVNNVSRHPHIRSSPVLGLRALFKGPLRELESAVWSVCLARYGWSTSSHLGQ
ncbi:hypothetical protein B0T13DRAFT_406402, partial [Neurospora crassa]